MKGKISNRQISAEEGYLRLYADLIGEDKDAIYTSNPDRPDDDIRNKMRNPIGNLKDNIDLCLGIFRKVNERAADVVSLRYGLDGNGIRTYNEIISELNYDVSYERIRQVMAKGMRMLRHPSRLRIMTYGASAIEYESSKSDTSEMMDSVDINSVHDADQRYAVIHKFVNAVILKTSFYDFCDNASLSVRAHNCLKRGLTGDKCIGEMLLPDGGFDIMKIRNCGIYTANEIRDAVAEWASTYLGKLTYDELTELLNPYVSDLLVYNNGIDFTPVHGFGRIKMNEVKGAVASWAGRMLGDVSYDELVALLKDVSKTYITEQIQEKTRAQLNYLIVELKNHDLKPYIESIYGRFCTEPKMSHEQNLYFLNVLHCRTFYDLVKISGNIPETALVRDVDAGTINKILEKWCRKEGVDKATVIDLLRGHPVSDEMNFLRKIDGSMISSYFSGSSAPEFRLEYTNCKYKGFNIWEVPDVVMYDIICEWLSALTPKAMNLQWGLESNRLFKGGDSTTQLEWAKRETESETDIEILTQIQRIFAEKGFQISLEQATFLWVTYSVKKLRKDWAPPVSDTNTWMNIVAYVFTDDIILRSLKRYSKW